MDSGPPSIGLDDAAGHNEFDLGMGDAPALELDLGGGPGSAPQAEPPPEISLSGESGLDFPVPVGISPRDSVVDLPGPVSVDDPALGRPPSPRADSNHYALDLPAPVGSESSVQSGLDLPTPVELGGQPASDHVDLPAPAELNLPVPADQGAPADQGVPPDERLDLPIPADLPIPGEVELPRPLNLDVTPANLGVEPKAGTELAPHDLPTPHQPSSADQGVLSSSIPGAVVHSDAGMTDHAAPASAEAAAPAPGRSAPRSPADLGGGRPAVSGGVLIAAGGLLLVGLAGAGVLYSGILDDPQPAGRRGVPRGEGKAEGKAPPSVPSASGQVVDRSPEVLAKMAEHTPAAYLAARDMAAKAGDIVGKAEAELLLHLAYGPNPPLAAEATAALQPHAQATSPYVTRVIGLAALAAGSLAQADKSLSGEDPRSRLYRGLLRLDQQRLDEAEVEAKAVIVATPDEMGARQLALAIEARRDPAAALPKVKAAVDNNPEHAGLQALLATTAIEAGQLATARAAVDALDPAATDDPGVQAWTYAQRARVKAAQGDAAGALADYERALELVPKTLPLQTARVRVLLLVKRYNDASGAASALVREHPQDLEVKRLQAEVALQSGDGDIALEILAKLAEAMPKDAGVVRLSGEVHAMRLAVEEGQTAFAAARALDPHEYEASVGEAILLADAKRLPDALKVLEAALTQAEDAGRSADVVRLLITKAEILERSGDARAALEALDRALEVLADHNGAQLRRGILRLAEGQVEQGRADLGAVFGRTGGYPGLAGPLGRLYLADGDWEGLERLLGAQLHDRQTDEVLLIIGARLRLHQGRIADARTLVEAALLKAPNDWEAHMLLAQVLIAEGKFAEALAQIERSRPAEPQPELMLQRGKVFEFNGKHEQALPEYKSALDRDPEVHEARFLYARLLAHGGANRQAIAELEQILKAPAAATAPWFPEVWLNIGVAQQGLGKYGDAIKSLRQATTLDPRLGEAYAQAGKYHEDRNKHADAIAALNKAVELGTKDDHWYAGALMDLGRAQSKSGKNAGAKESLKKFLEVAPAAHASRAEAERLLGTL